ncbi:DMT family transporter [Jannaschia sp. KMU-145]|uniref:DMT family transporter n=1 Tax=Jannaschia halovivens TaxID=3388667 RepID=UPI00396B1EB9
MGDKASPLPGIMMALGAFALFSAHDVAIKLLGGNGYAVFQIVFFSVLFSFPLAVVMLLRDDFEGNLKPRHPWWTALRTVSAVITGMTIFYAFTVLPLAQTYAIIFASPLIITILSIPVLGEKVRLMRWAAVIVGLIGVMIVLRPGSVELGIGHAAALTGAFFSSLASVIVRKIGREERAAVLMLYPMVANFVVMGALMPLVYRPMPVEDLGLWVLVAAGAFIASLMMIQAYRRADAVLVAPMQYSQIIWAALYGWLFFGETIDGGTAIGASVIIASGLFIVFREGRGNSATTPVLRTRSRAETGTNLRIGPMLTRAERDAHAVPPPATATRD